jgi:hypothetical protein
MRISFGKAVLGLALLLGAGTPAQASLMVGGNTRPQFQPGGNGVDGFVDFGVYNTAGGSAGDTYGTGLAGIDAAILAGFGAPAGTGSFLYLYEISNKSSSFGIAAGSLPGDSSSVLAFGTLAGKSFNDAAGPASSTNPFGTAASPGDPSAISTGVTSPGIVVNGAVITPLVSSGGGSVNAFFFPTSLSTGQTSALFGYMSKMAPSLALASIQGGGASGGTGAAGTVEGAPAVPLQTSPPSTVPEPSTLALFGLGTLGLAGWRLRRQHAAK